MMPIAHTYTTSLSAACKDACAAVGGMGFEGKTTPPARDLDVTIYALTRRGDMRHVTVRQSGL